VHPSSQFRNTPRPLSRLKSKAQWGGCCPVLLGAQLGAYHGACPRINWCVVTQRKYEYEAAYAGLVNGILGLVNGFRVWLRKSVD